jgi:hypothetical protein
VPCPPFAFVKGSDPDDRLEAQILERFLANPTLAPYAQQQVHILSAIYPDFELMAIHPPSTTSSPGETTSIKFSFLRVTGITAVVNVVYICLGPLVCQLTLTGPYSEGIEQYQILDAIGKTFRLRDVKFLTRIDNRLPPFGETQHQGQLAGAFLNYPRICRSLFIPQGWESTDQNGTVHLQRGSDIIRVYRYHSNHGDIDSWLSETMLSLQKSGTSLLSLRRGELSRGPYIALMIEEARNKKTWSTGAIPRTVILFVSDEQAVLYYLQTSEPNFKNNLVLLDHLIAATELLPPTEWETDLLEPWMDLRLKGRWYIEGPGIYVTTEECTLVAQLSRDNGGALSLGKVRDTIIGSMRAEQEFASIKSEEEATGIWKGHDAFRYSLEYISSELEEFSVRISVLASESILYSIFLKGTDKSRVDKTFTAMLEAVNIGN